LLVEYNVSHVSCYGGSDGEIGVDLSNGLSPYTFYINGVENVISPPYDSLFTNLSEGVYIITGIDSDSCGVVETIFIDAPAFPLQVLSSNSITICDTSSEGSAVAYAAGGSPYPDGSYNFEWFTDSWGSLGVGDSIDNLGVGNYYLEVTDSNFCQSHIPINVSTAQLPLFISPQLFGVVCTGDSSGSAVVFSGGGTAPYDYEWSTLVGYVLSTSFGVIDRDTLSDLLAGSYHLSITDASGCMDEMTFTIDEAPVRLEISDVLVVDSIDCYGSLDGRGIVYMLNGSGSPAYSYLWDNGETTALANSLSGGWHTVEVSDTRGCLVVDSVFIPENDIIKSDLSIIVPVSCYGYSDGEIGVNTVGGIPFVASPGYEYFWSNGVQPNFDFIDNLSHGSYYLTTRDALGCVVVDSIYLPEPDPLYVTAQEILRVSCYEDSTGTAYAVGMGGTAPYDFTWQNNIISSVSNDSSIVYTLFAGLETVVLEDSRGCISSDTVLIHQPDELIVSISDSVFAYCIGVNTASATASVIGGTSPYTYEWNDNNVVPQTTITASDLDAGIYMVTVQDSRGCLDSVNVVLDSVTSVMEVNISSLSAGGNSVSCYGSDDGELTAIVFSGTSPYTYQWVGPTGVSSNDTIFNLTSGNYSVTVTDVNGCVVNTNKVLTEPDPLLYKVLSTTASTCLGSCDGVVELYIEGGVTPYQSILQNNVTNQLDTFSLIQDCGIQVADNFLDGDITNNVIWYGDLLNYEVDTGFRLHLRDSIANTSYLSAESNTIVNGIWEFNVELDFNPSTSNYARVYLVSDEQDLGGALNGYFVKVGGDSGVVDDISLFVQNGNNTIKIIDGVDGLAAITPNLSIKVTRDNIGNWELFVDSQSGYTSQGTIFDTTYVNSEYFGVECFYTITRSDKFWFDNFRITSECDDIIEVTDVCTGDYTVLVSDSNMCDAVLLGGGSSQALLDATITTDVAVSQQSISCYGDSTGVISINNPQIGALYSYLWENLNGDTIGITTTVDSLPAGDYILYSSYSNIDGCTTRDTVTVLQNSLVHSAVILINVSCNGGNDGAIETTTFGGVSPYTYSWTPQSGTTSNLTSLSAGTYDLSIEDSNGCDVIESYQVGEPSEVEVNVTTSQGYILTANASGGTPPYSYAWEEQSTANSLGAQQTYTVVSNGIYYVVVTDANGCIETSGDTEFDETTGLINTVGGIALNIYPNPFKDETTVDFGREIKEATITIVDVYGKLIETYNVTNQQTQIIKRNNKASGVYFLEIEMEEEEPKIVKIVLEK
jgi:hypothetical protein